MKTKNHIWAGKQKDIKDGQYLRIEVLYKNEPSSIIIFRYQGMCLAYRNLCVHMPRRLDCEKDMIFDQAGKNLRCSMHGIVYDPLSGESLSDICLGKKLTSVKIEESQEDIWICDKRVKPIDK